MLLDLMLLVEIVQSFLYLVVVTWLAGTVERSSLVHQLEQRYTQAPDVRLVGILLL